MTSKTVSTRKAQRDVFFKLFSHCVKLCKIFIVLTIVIALPAA